MVYFFHSVHQHPSFIKGVGWVGFSQILKNGTWLRKSCKIRGATKKGETFKVDRFYCLFHLFLYETSTFAKPIIIKNQWLYQGLKFGSQKNTLTRVFSNSCLTFNQRSLHVNKGIKDFISQKYDLKYLHLPHIIPKTIAII